MKKYTFRKGNHDASPAPQLPRFAAVRGALAPILPGTMRAKFKFTDSCWFDWRLPDGSQDADILDWNYKLFGWSPFAEPGNWNGVVLAARPHASQRGVLEFTFYQNVDRANQSNESRRFSYAIADLNEVEVSLRRERRGELHMDVVVRLKNGDTKTHRWAYKLAKDYATYRELFLWFGGANNAEGEFGGVPDKDITIYAEKL